MTDSAPRQRPTAASGSVATPHGSMVGRDAITGNGSGRQHLVAFALLLIATGAFFFPVLFQGQSFTAVRNDETIVHPWTPLLPTLGPGPVQSDQADLSYPWQVDLTQAVHPVSYTHLTLPTN